MDQYGISIVITAFKSQDYLTDLLNSIEKNIKNNLNIEVLIGIDECEITKTKLLEIQKNKNYPWLKIYWNKKNKGTYILRNSLVLKTEYDNILFVDSDDIMNEILIKSLKHVLENYDHIKLITYGSIRFRSKEHLQKIKNGKGVPFDGTFMVKKKTFIELGGFKPWRCGADTDFHARFKHVFAKNRCHISRILMYCRITDASLTRHPKTREGSAERNYALAHLFGEKKNQDVNIKNITTELEYINY